MEFLPQIITGKRNRPASVLLFDLAVQVGRIADLGLYLFISVPEIIISDQSYDDPLLIPARDLKCAPSL